MLLLAAAAPSAPEMGGCCCCWASAWKWPLVVTCRGRTEYIGSYNVLQIKYKQCNVLSHTHSQCHRHSLHSTLLTYVHYRRAEDDLTAVSTKGSPLLLHSIYVTTPIAFTQSLLLPQTPFSRPIKLSLPPPHIHHPTPPTPFSLSRSQSRYSQCQS